MKGRYILTFLGILLLIAVLRIAIGISNGEDMAGEVGSILRVVFRRLLG